MRQRKSKPIYRDGLQSWGSWIHCLKTYNHSRLRRIGPSSIRGWSLTSICGLTFLKGMSKSENWITSMSPEYLLEKYEREDLTTSRDVLEDGEPEKTGPVKISSKTLIASLNTHSSMEQPRCSTRLWPSEVSKFRPRDGPCFSKISGRDGKVLCATSIS